MGGSGSKTKKTHKHDNISQTKTEIKVVQKTLYILHPPKNFENEFDLRTSWSLWKKSFLKYMEQTTSPKSQWGYILLNLMGPVGQSVCKEFYYKNPRDETDVNVLMKKLDEYCMFGHRKKYENENAQKYLISLQKLAESRNVPCMEEAIKKKIIDEIDEIQFTKTACSFMPFFAFPRFHSLDLREIAFIWDTYEKRYNSKQDHFNNSTQSELIRRNCNFCGSDHMPKVCPAYGSHCVKCKRPHHFQWKCHIPICNNCKFCGGSHIASRAKCPAHDSFCTKCQQRGHFITKCPKQHARSKYQL